MADYTNRRFFRAKLPIQVVRGFYPTEPNKLSSLAAPADATSIKSGMAIVKDGSGEWIPALDAHASHAVDANGQSIFIALQDADSLDVQASGKLVGLDCSDKYEIQSGYFDDTEVWAVGDKLTVGTTGLFVKAVQHATEIVQVIGEITEIGAVDTTNAIAYQGFTPSCAAADATFIQFKTLDQSLSPVAWNTDAV